MYNNVSVLMCKLIPNFSHKYAEGTESCNFALPYSLAKDVDEMSGLSSGRFISDFPCTEVLISLHLTVLLIINY